MDAVALAATIGGSIVALAGVGATAWSAKQQRESAKELETSRQTHERLLASGARLFEKRSAVYERLVGGLELSVAEINATATELITNGEYPEGYELPELPEKPSDDETRAMITQLRTFGSKAVADEYEHFLNSIHGYWSALYAVDDVDDAEALRKVGDAHDRVLADLRAIERLVSDELAAL